MRVTVHEIDGKLFLVVKSGRFLKTFIDPYLLGVGDDEIFSEEAKKLAIEYYNRKAKENDSSL